MSDAPAEVSPTPRQCVPETSMNDAVSALERYRDVPCCPTNPPGSAEVPTFFPTIASALKATYASAAFASDTVVSASFSSEYLAASASAVACVELTRVTCDGIPVAESLDGLNEYTHTGCVGYSSLISSIDTEATPPNPERSSAIAENPRSLSHSSAHLRIASRISSRRSFCFAQTNPSPNPAKASTPDQTPSSRKLERGWYAALPKSLQPVLCFSSWLAASASAAAAASSFSFFSLSFSVRSASVSLGLGVFCFRGDPLPLPVSILSSLASVSF
mmetsp:Transcript_7294/g.27442  ORF Transcript_7294/g.27442 Transcript_7294/m.27442 type:complete len:275 (+) Transcript_7294:894-1718(+)